jgi:hypothetical protein
MSVRDEDELIRDMHSLADWVEKVNNVHCHSSPRKAAFTIARLQEENNLLRLQLNKVDRNLYDYINIAIGSIRLGIYILKKKMKKVRK